MCPAYQVCKQCNSAPEKRRIVLPTAADVVESDEPHVRVRAVYPSVSCRAYFGELCGCAAAALLLDVYAVSAVRLG